MQKPGTRIPFKCLLLGCPRSPRGAEATLQESHTVYSHEIRAHSIFTRESLSMSGAASPWYPGVPGRVAGFHNCLGVVETWQRRTLIRCCYGAWFAEVLSTCSNNLTYFKSSFIPQSTPLQSVGVLMDNSRRT